MSANGPGSTGNPDEQNHLGNRLNILRAGVLGANDGIVSTAGLVLGVAATTTERAALELEKHELATDPEGELDELTGLYQAKGLTPELAREVAIQLTSVGGGLAAHAEVELGIAVEHLVSPWNAAITSGFAFTVGSLLPLIAVLVTSPTSRSPVTFFAMLVALVVTGSVSARLGGADRKRAVVRVVVGGALAMAVTYGIGRLVGTAM